MNQNSIGITALAFLLASTQLCAEESIDYGTQVAPIFAKYCVGCHNDEDREGKLSLESFASLQQGGAKGPALLPQRAADSRLIRLLDGTAEPKMPPEDNEGPTAAEIELLRKWIEAGAVGPQGQEPSRNHLAVPAIKPATGPARMTALAASSDGTRIAIARFGRVEILDAESNEVQQTIKDLPGKVNAVHFSADGKSLVTASGISGLYGVASIWSLADASLIREFQGHRDILYDAELSPDGKTLATASYDSQILLWNAENGEPLHTLTGHNDAIYDLAFSPDGTALVSASGDETVKVWHVQQGIRLDTLHQPQAEQYVVKFSPSGDQIIAGGADNRIRVWRFVSREKQQINPLQYARFAHEGAVVGLEFAREGQTLLSVGEDLAIKAWETAGYSQTHIYETQPGPVTGVSWIAPKGNLFVGRLSGSTATYPVENWQAQETAAAAESPAPEAAVVLDAHPNRVAEHEPNNAGNLAMDVFLPAQISGVIGPDASDEADLFRFQSKAGRSWILETIAARNKSPLDTRLEVLDASGQPVVRVLLQAVRDSYFTFRGQNSDTADGFRLHNWEEMDVNQFLYASGEVVKLWHYPRGPDSGFQLYPGRGKRFTYFDTTPSSHPLHEPCYIVEPRQPGTNLLPNGLPVFPIYFENDDDGRRELGTDSRLTFTAPQDGQYLVRVTDARGFAGADFKYDLTIRAQKPDFEVSLGGANPTVNAGSGKEFTVTAKRLDGFEGPINVEIEGLPPGFYASSPLVIEAGQTMATGTINAVPDAPAPTPENAKTSKVTAQAMVAGQEVSKNVNSLGEIKLAEKPKVIVRLAPRDAEQAPEVTPDKPLELVVIPGRTTVAKVIVERHGFEGRIGFGNADAGRNLPHGVYVDNIGLNGLLIVEGKSERSFFITAAPWVPESTRLFHLQAQVEGNQTSWPVLLKVKRAEGAE